MKNEFEFQDSEENSGSFSAEKPNTEKITDEVLGENIALSRAEKTRAEKIRWSEIDSELSNILIPSPAGLLNEWIWDRAIAITKLIVNSENMALEEQNKEELAIFRLLKKIAEALFFRVLKVVIRPILFRFLTKEYQERLSRFEEIYIERAKLARNPMDSMEVSEDDQNT